MDLANNVANFKFLSKQSQWYGKILSIYDYVILDDTSFNQKYLLICAVSESLFKNAKFDIANFRWKHW